MSVYIIVKGERGQSSLMVHRNITYKDILKPLGRYFSSAIESGATLPEEEVTITIKYTKD